MSFFALSISVLFSTWLQNVEPVVVRALVNWTETFFKLFICV